jgi:threonine synthase
LPDVSGTGQVSLGEGDTPLVALPRWGHAHGLRRVYAKLEFANPSGSFKDRGMAVLVSLARQAGAEHLTEDSSGNAGASAAAYAARAGLRCTVYAPAAAPAAKLRQITAYGAELIPVPGPRSAVADAARAAGSRPGSYHVSHNDNPDFVTGNKTFAYEVVEALPGLAGGAAADRPWHVVTPCGGGALFYGAWLGFLDALAGRGEMAAESGSGSGGVDPGRTLPRMHAAQTTSCPPIAAAWERGLDEPAPVERRPSVCGGIEIERPARGREILRAIRDSAGSAIASDDAQILAERDRLAQSEGIYAEPTSAAAFAGLARLAQRGVVGPDDLVIVAVTGSGLKDPGPA